MAKQHQIELKCLPYLKETISNDELHQLLSYVSKHNNVKPIILLALCSLYQCSVDLNKIETMDGSKKCIEFIQQYNISCLCDTCSLSDTYCCAFTLSEQFLLHLCMKQLSSIDAIEKYIATHFSSYKRNYEEYLFASQTLLEATDISDIMCIPLHRHIFQYLQRVMVFSVDGLYKYLLECVVGLDERQQSFIYDYITHIYELNPKKMDSLETLVDTIMTATNSAETTTIETPEMAHNSLDNVNSTPNIAKNEQLSTNKPEQFIGKDEIDTISMSSSNNEPHYPTEESWAAFDDADIYQDIENSIAEACYSDMAIADTITWSADEPQDTIPANENLPFETEYSQETTTERDLQLVNSSETAVLLPNNIDDNNIVTDITNNLTILNKDTSSTASEETEKGKDKLLEQEVSYLNENGFLKNHTSLTNVKNLIYVNTLEDAYMLKYALVRSMDIALECIFNPDDNTHGFLFYICEDKYFYYLPFNKENAIIHGALLGIFKDTSHSIYTMYAVPVLYYIQKYGYEAKNLISIYDLCSIITKEPYGDPKQIIRTVACDFCIPTNEFIPFAMKYYRNIIRKFSHKYSVNTKKRLSSLYYRNQIIAKSYMVKRYASTPDVYVTLKNGNYEFNTSAIQNKVFKIKGSFLIANYENKVAHGRYVAAFHKIIEKMYTTSLYQTCNFLIINLTDNELCFFVEEQSMSVFMSAFNHLLLKSGERYVNKIPQVQLIIKDEYTTNKN